VPLKVLLVLQLVISEFDDCQTEDAHPALCSLRNHKDPNSHSILVVWCVITEKMAPWTAML